ncbi:thiamine ABC transporter ATP-binding protein [Aureimonas fodinaquatilis]|nr:thiamine ABC transporter ATP-binding protein [Aureimonas fodinaquatilis]
MPILVVENLTYAYQGAAMHFDLAVEAGEWLAIVGPSGAGKSTLLDLIAGFITPVAGRILIDGRDLTDVAPGERPVSFLFQENNLFPHLTALQNVVLGLTSRMRPDASQKLAAGEALAMVGLGGFETRLPAQMSGGERQRVALARAMVRKRPILMLDEPFAALGPAMRLEMLELLSRLRLQTGMAILMVTHQPDDAAGYAEKLAFVDNGEIVLSGNTSTLLTPPVDSRIASYLGKA